MLFLSNVQFEERANFIRRNPESIFLNLPSTFGCLILILSLIWCWFFWRFLFVADNERQGVVSDFTEKCCQPTTWLYMLFYPNCKYCSELWTFMQYYILNTHFMLFCHIFTLNSWPGIISAALFMNIFVLGMDYRLMRLTSRSLDVDSTVWISAWNCIYRLWFLILPLFEELHVVSCVTSAVSCKFWDNS